MDRSTKRSLTMNRLYKIIACSVSLLWTLHQVNGERVFTLQEVADRGGLNILNPVQIEENKWFVPLRFDVSGRRKITSDPIKLDSYTMIGSIDVSWENGSLYFSLERSNIANPWSKREVYGFFVEDVSGKLVSIFYRSQNDETLLKTLDFREVAYPQLGTQEPPPKVEE